MKQNINQLLDKLFEECPKGTYKVPVIETPKISEAEQFLIDMNVSYTISNGIITVDDNLNIIDKGLTDLPDLRQVIVKGDFDCSNNQLTSLQYAPQTVTGDFYCNNNQLTSLQYAPQTVSGYFDCSSNQLTSLQYAPQTVTGGFYCCNNQLTSLEHVSKDFKTLYSDFGTFASYSKIPKKLLK